MMLISREMKTKIVEANQKIKEKNYWLEIFSEKIEKKYFPYDFKEKKDLIKIFSEYKFNISNKSFECINSISSGVEINLLMILLTEVYILLKKYSSTQDCIVGLPILKQDRAQYLINTVIALKKNIDREINFKQLLNDTRLSLVEGMKNQNYPYDVLIEQVEGGKINANSLFDVAILLKNIQDESYLSEDYYNLLFSFEKINDRIEVSIKYNENLYKNETIVKIGNQLLRLFDQTLSNPKIKLKDIELLSDEEKQQLLYEFNHTQSDYPKDKTIHELFEEQVDKTPDNIALVHDKEQITYKELDNKSNQIAHYLRMECGVTADESIGIYMDKGSNVIISILGILKSGCGYLPLSVSYPEERVIFMINDAFSQVIISERKYVKEMNKFQWECPAFSTYICLDSYRVSEEQESKNGLNDRKLWEYVGDESVDEVTGGGWNSSYTGQPIPQEEMDEYGDNILKKLEPLITSQTRILEIGCASGISMFRLAPKVELYYGTDLSDTILKKNEERINSERHSNIIQKRLSADEIDQIEEADFDIVIINSVIQCFDGHNYLKKVIRKAIDLMKSEGLMFFGDIMDQDLKHELKKDFEEFKRTNTNKDYKTKTDWREELFLSRGFWDDLKYEETSITKVESSRKIYTLENELTKYRYDVLISIDKNQEEIVSEKNKNKIQHDLNILSNYSTERLPQVNSPDNLAYIIYTSGSTGKPKGVAIKNCSLVNLCIGHNNFYGISHKDHINSYAEFSFDASVWEIFPSLIAGASLYFIDDNIRLDPEKVNNYFEERDITISFLPTQFCEIFMEYDNKSLRVLLTGGDKLNSFTKRGYKLYNNYGPTENTVVSTRFEVAKLENNIPIGKPIENSQVYILDSYQQLQPIGVSGELCVSGEGLAIAYYKNPELTKEKFIDHPFKEGERLYKTGDLARWLPDGNIEFLGRIDHQVKMRGFRIELSEIENTLLKHENIKESVVLVWESDNDKYLCAYVVCEKAFKQEEIRKHLSANLPDYMIPSYFVELEELPLTTNGKVNRKALLSPEVKAGKDYVAPSNKTEEKLVVIWSEVLNVAQEEISTTANFFAIGGHSLRATILVSKIHKEFGVKLPLKEVFQNQTITALSLIISKLSKVDYSSIKLVDKREYYSLSSAQKRMYFIQQLDLQSTSYNMPLVFTFGVDLNVDSLENAIIDIISRHESFRTSFVTINNESFQRVHDKVDFKLGNKKTTKENLEQDIKEFIRPFDLSKDILLRVCVMNVSKKQHVVVVDMHHIISDGTSSNIVKADFMKLFNGEKLNPLKLQYRDFSYWQNKLIKNGELKKQENYWINLLSGNIPKLNLQTDYKRPARFSFKGDVCEFSLDENDTALLRKIGFDNGSTLYMNILAILNSLFYRFTNQNDIIIGCSIAGRHHSDLQGVMGMFVNVLSMRNYPNRDKTYIDFLNDVTDNSVSAFENQDVQFEDLVDILNVERDLSRNPLFDICMVVQNFGDVAKEQAGNIIIHEESILNLDDVRDTSKFDMTFFVTETTEKINISIEYYVDIFKRETIERYIRCFKNIVKTIVINPKIKLKDIELLSDEEKRQLLYEFNDTQSDYPKDKTIHELFEEQVDKTPDNIALVYDKEQITYKELDNKSNQVAHYLRMECGVTADESIGIYMDKGSNVIISILGILKSGCGYLPLSVSYPEERVMFMINDASSQVIISERKYVKEMNKFQWECPAFSTYICLDSYRVSEEQESKNGLNDRKLWEYVGEESVDEVTGGGWTSSYTGQPIPQTEMDEYGDNILKKLEPIITTQTRILEIGCASGISMFRLAPKVGLYYGTDLSGTILEKNEDRINLEGYSNIIQKRLAADEIDQIEEKDFDLVIINSVIQCFDGHNYLKKVIRKAIDLMKPEGVVFLGDIMDQDLKKDLVKDLVEFKQKNTNKNYNTKTDWSEELFLSRGFWDDLECEEPSIEKTEYSSKIYTMENELTKFRYDVLILINKNYSLKDTVKKKNKFQHDLNILNNYSIDRLPSINSSKNLAYIIYTSGSTGKPKGVMVEHRNVVQLFFNDNFQFEFSEKDVWTMFHSHCFDFSVWEMYGALLYGGKLVVIPKDISRDVVEYYNVLCEEKVTVLNQTPSAFYSLAEVALSKSGKFLGNIRYVIFGGEALKPNKLKEWFDVYSDVKLINMFGITETTVHVTYKEIGKYEIENNISNIGTSIPNLTTYIVDENLRLVPIGIAGELLIGGDGVSRGYLGREDLTKEKFIQSPYNLSERLYCSGDLVKMISNGEMEYLGRIDDQVQLRGFRIELGEIETVLLKYENIKESVVVAREENGDKHLCAYIVSEKELNQEEIRTFLSAQIPDYMIPSYFVELEKIPLTVNGKIDRKSLPEPKVKAGYDYVVASNLIEEKLIIIWSEILNIPVEEISVTANFFSIGGHSLKATILTGKIHKELGVEFPLRDVFLHSTVKAQSSQIGISVKKEFVSIQKAQEKTRYPLSSAQRRLYLLQQMALESTAYNMPYVISLSNDDNKEKIEEVFQQLIMRHESFRTSFEVVGEEPVQRIHEQVEFKIEEITIEKEEVQEFRNKFIQAFDLSQAPLLRAAIVETKGEGSLLMIDMHHIISDGVSQAILEHEFQALSSGEVLPALKLQYRDYSQWQNSKEQQEKIKDQEDYWLRRFEGEIPILNLPIDNIRPLTLSNEGDIVTVVISPKQTRFVRSLCSETGTTLYMSMLSVFSILLSKLSGQDEFVVGQSIAGRNHPDLQKIVGMFVNSLPIKVNLDKNKSFNEFLSDIKDTTLNASENQEYQFDELVNKLNIQREVGRNPIFDVMVNMIDATGDNEHQFDNIDEYLINENIGRRFDLTLNVTNSKNGIILGFQYYPKIFNSETIIKFSQYFKNIISQLEGKSNPKISEIELLTKSEKEKVQNKLGEKLISRRTKLPISFHQERIWFIDKFEKNNLYKSSPVYHNIPLILDIEGNVYVKLLEQSIQYIISRHDILRSRFYVDEEKLYHRILDKEDFLLKELITNESQKCEVVDNEIHVPFDLEKDSLFRAVLLKVSENKQTLLLVVHHIISDKYSLKLLAKEIIESYHALHANKSIVQAKLPIHFADYINWQRETYPILKDHLLSYWKPQLKGRLQVLELPEDTKRAKIHIFKAGEYNFDLPESLTKGIYEYANLHNFSIEVVLLGFYKILLGKYANQKEILIGTSVDGRSNKLTKGVVGPVSNLIVLRSIIDFEEDFTTYISKLDKTIKESLEYKDIPFDQLVSEINPAKDMSRTALFDILFQYEEYIEEFISDSELKINTIASNLGFGKYDQNLLFQRKGSVLQALFVYNTEYYRKETIVRLFDHYIQLVTNTLKQADQKLSTLEIITEAEKQQLLYEFNDTKTDFPKDKTIHQLFEEQVNRTPDNIALKIEGERFTYSKLNDKANSIANTLRENGICRDDVVAIFLDRSIEAIFSMLGVLKSGGAYLPIDPDYPNDRIEFMLTDSGAKTVITTKILSDRVEFGGNIICVEGVLISANRFSNIETINRSSDLSYIIYTSGTTGKPKGVMVEHRNVVRLFFNDKFQFEFSEKDVWTMFHSHCFDFSVWEMYGALLYGGKLIIIPKDISRDVVEYYNVLCEEKVTVLNQTPSAFYNLAEVVLSKPKNSLENLRYVIFGGEALKPDKLKEWFDVYSNVKLINMFGITETTVHVTYKEIGKYEIENNISNIGTSIPTLTTYVVDRDLRLVPKGLAGELLIGGEGVSRGYLGREDLTREKFIKNPYNSKERLYRSGDLVRMLSNGEMEYLGRIDDQVQLRGFRIELGEIESTINKLDSIKDAVVIDRQDKNGDKYLCAYIVCKVEINQEEIRTYLSASLPDYMIPSYFVELEKLPLTSNGKKDRKSLPEPNKIKKQWEPPTNIVEEELINMWCEILGISEKQIGVNYNIFDLGGNSIKVTVYKTRIMNNLDIDIPLSEMMKNPSFKELATYIESVNLVRMQESNIVKIEQTKLII